MKLAILIFCWLVTCPLLADSSVITVGPQGSYAWNDKCFAEILRHQDWRPAASMYAPPGRGSHDILWLRLSMPKFSFQDANLFIFGVDELFEIYSAQGLLYKFGNMDSKEKAYQGLPWHIVKLPKDVAGNYIYVRIYSKTELIGLKKELVIGEFQHLQTRFLQQTLPQLIVSIILLFMGFLSLISYLINRRKVVFLTFSFACFMCGLFVLGVSRVGQIFFENPIFWLTMDRIPLLGIPVSFLAYYEFSLRKKPAAIGIALFAVHWLYLMVGIVWSIYDRRFLTFGLRPFQMLNMISMIYVSTSVLFYIAVRGRHMRKQDLIFFIGLSFSILAGINDTLLDMEVGVFRHSWILAHFGMLATNISFGLILIQQLREEIDRRTFLEHSLNDANAVQEALLPPFLDAKEVSIKWHYRAAEDIGGDWFTYFLDEKHQDIYLLIGDVTGHGTASALLAAAVAGTASSEFDRISKDDPSSTDLKNNLIRIAKRINQSVYTIGERSNRWMTMAFVVFSLRDGSGWYLNAGHNSIFKIAGDAIHEILVPGTPLGCVKNFKAEPKALQLLPGDSLFLYTDGLLENSNQHGKHLHTRELSRLLSQSNDELIHQVIGAAEACWGDTPAIDDTTILHITWKQQLRQKSA